jgi:ABC-type nitrate/sulfonate/bicarbonate transport system ATPase subunit
MIRFRNVNKSFGGRTVLKDVTFEVKDHETVAVLGASGSGKTTLLRLIAGTLKPDFGAVEVDSPRIGFIFQDHRLLPWRTAQDNIALPRRASGKPREEARRRARSWMDRLALQGFYDYYPRQLSGGMMQRVSIARAFALEPDIMLMDEPFSSLDASLADALLRDLKQVLSGYRATAVYVTHEFPEALRMASRIFQLRDSTIEETFVADPATALRDYYNRLIKNASVSYGDTSY